jgi:hypothetical protein
MGDAVERNVKHRRNLTPVSAIGKEQQHMCSTPY